MIFLPDAILKTFLTGAVLLCTSHTAAALEPGLATCTANDTLLPTVVAADQAPAAVASKESTGDIAPSRAPELSSSTVSKAGPFVVGAALSGERLGSLRGGTDTAITGATLGGVVTANSATNLLTGSNTIDAGSFANSTGIPVVIQNTGANVLIQNATVINLQLK